MMFQCSIILLSIAPTAARVLHNNVKGHWAHKMDVDMRPEVVSSLLSSVEAKWTQEAVNVLSTQTAESVAFAAMETSCVKVSSAVVQGSEGDRLRVIEYMKTVCNEPNAKSNIEMCGNFANAMQEFMIGDNVYNREQLDMHDFCHKFWSTYVMPAGKAQKKKLDDEEAARLAIQKKQEEEEIERRKKLAVEAAMKKLAEQKLQNNTGLTVAARWNAGLKTNQSTSEATSTITTTSTNAWESSTNASAPIEVTTTSTMSPPSLAHALATHVDNGNATQASKSLMVHNTTVVQNATVQDLTSQKTFPYDLHDDQAAQNTTIQKNLTLNADTGKNQTQLQKNTTKLLLHNATVVQKDLMNATTVQSKLTARVMKQLKFVLNHTRKNITNESS